MNLKRLQLKIIQLDAVDSTNNYAANLIKETNVVNGLSVLTKRQFKGKGQRGAEWISAPGANLTASIILLPALRVDDSFYLNIITSLAITQLLRDLHIQAHIKWPNDIYINDKKVAGILIENQLMGTTIKSAIVGVGLNINQLTFPPTVNATSIGISTSMEWDVQEIFMQLFIQLDFYLDLLLNKQYAILKTAYYSLLYQRGVLATYEDENGIFEGEIIGINGSGLLQIKSQDKLLTYNFKEVKFK